jgi:hypothetical protein
MQRTPEWTEEDFRESRDLVKKQLELNKQVLEEVKVPEKKEKEDNNKK